jgi:Uma2 family endonuclease
MSAAIELMTAEEFLMMPHDGFRYDLVKGELLKMSPAGGEHGVRIGRLSTALGRHVEDNDLGEVLGAETGFKLFSNPDTVRAPDIAFVSKERIPEGDFSEKFWEFAPDLAVEVVSPSESYDEVLEKIDDYLEAGVKAVWIVRSRKKTVSVYRAGQPTKVLTVNDALDGEDVVPGFKYSIAKLFARNRSDK